MDMDDSFTKSLLQCSRARKENLNEKRIGISFVSKKRVPLVDEQQINPGSSDVQPEESPKRQCVEASQSVYSPHDKENFQMQDEDSNAAFVPFHSTSKSRSLAALKKNFMTAKEPSPVQNNIPASVQEHTNTNVDPAELPLDARKALLEKALLSGTQETNIDPEHAFSESDAVHRASDYDEESDSEDEAGNEYDEKDEHKIENENMKECSDEESDAGESGFDSQDSEIASLMSMESNYSNESNIWPREDTQSISSQNSQSAASFQSDSGVSSYSYSSCYNASRSQSCTSDDSARSYDVMNSDAMEGTSSSFKENNCDMPLLRTVSLYRKQKQETRLTPHVHTIVRRENVLSPESLDDDYTEKIQKHIKDLQNKILLQQSVINEANKALNLCSATAEFSGSAMQVEAKKHLLIATQTCQFCLNEISYLKTCSSHEKNVIDGECTLLISNIQLPLKREFMASVLEGRGTDTVHYFWCLIRHGAQVIGTQTISTTDKVSDGALCFTNCITLKNLPVDFSVVFEVYALQTKKEILPHEKKYHIKKQTKKEVLTHEKKCHIKKEYSKIRLTPKGKKLDGKILMPAITSPGGPNAVRSTSFGVIGFTRFTLQNCNIGVFTLEKVPFTSPLDGVLRVQLKLCVEHKIDKIYERGFLTMFEIVSGLASLQRRWCVLDAHYLAYWKYRDDEKTKNPNGVIDLKQCVTGKVKLCSSDVCARPHTFKLVTVSHQAKEDKNTTISSSYNATMETEHLLTADTKKEGVHWCNKLNKVLTYFRKWNPQALHPVESMQD